MTIGVTQATGVAAISAGASPFSFGVSGSTPRAITSKLAELPINPEDFGAIGDYNYTTNTGTDNTIALQNCINFASITGQAIMFAPGAKYLTGTLYGYYDAVLNPGYASKPGRLCFIGHASGIATGSLEPQGCALVHKNGVSTPLLSIVGIFSISQPGLTGGQINIERVNLIGGNSTSDVLYLQDCNGQQTFTDLYVQINNSTGNGVTENNTWEAIWNNVQIRGQATGTGSWTGIGLNIMSDTSTGQINMKQYNNVDVYKCGYGIRVGRRAVAVGTFGPLVWIGGQVSLSDQYGVWLDAGAYNCLFLGHQVEQSRLNAIICDSGGGNDLPRNCKFIQGYYTNNGKIADGSTSTFDVYVNDGVSIEFDQCIHQNSNSGYFFNASTATDLVITAPYFRTVTTYGSTSGYGFNYTGSYTGASRIHIKDAHYDQNFSSNPGPDAGVVMPLYETDLRRISISGNSTTPAIGLGGATGLLCADIVNFNNASATTVTNLLGGRAYKHITLTFSNVNTTIQSNGTTIQLNGSTNFTPSSVDSILVLLRNAAGKWVEVSRSQP